MTTEEWKVRKSAMPVLVGEISRREAVSFVSFVHGQTRVARFDLREPAYSVRWNPMVPISDALARGDAARATQLARTLAQVLTAHSAPGGGGNDAFWRESTVALVTSLVLAVADQAPATGKNVASVYRMLTTLHSSAHLNDSSDAGVPGDPKLVRRLES